MFLLIGILVFCKEFRCNVLLAKGVNYGKSYNFTEQEFRAIEKLADNIYNAGVVLKGFCTEYLDIEEVQNIYTVLKYMHKDADNLNSIFINFDTE